MSSFLDDFEACSRDLLAYTDPRSKLERLAFLINARERSPGFDPLMYFALVRRVADQLRPPIDMERERTLLLDEACWYTHPPGPYAKRAVRLARRVQELTS